MVGLLLPLIIASVVAALRVCSFSGLQRVHIQWWPLALASIAVQLVLYNPPVDQQPWALTWGPLIWVATLIALVAVLVRNGLSKHPGRGAFWVAALGIAVNLVVVVANGGYMPESTQAPIASPGG